MSTEGLNKNKVLLNRAMLILVPILFFGWLFSLNMKMSLNDPDLWWHLKTGETILETGTLMDQEDMFCYTSPKPLSEAQKIGLRAAWLGQVIIALWYKAGKLLGIILGRNLLIQLPMIILFLWLIRQKVNLWASLALVALPATMFPLQLFYSFERPQGFSFVFTLVAVLLLERVRDVAHSKKFDHSYWGFPLLMALWSNIHAGYIVGNIIIVIYMADEALVLAWHKYRKTKGYVVKPVFFIVCAAALLASAFNPNGMAIFYQYGRGLLNMFITDVKTRLGNQESASWVKDVVLEYKPLWYFYKELNYKWLVYYWAFTVLTYVVMLVRFWLRRTIDLADFLSLTFVVVFANMYARGIMFSLAVIPFYLAKSAIALKGLKPDMRFTFKAAVSAALLVAIAFNTTGYKRNPYIYEPSLKATQLISPWYPLRAVAFIQETNLHGPMYNYYTWGGFLIWTLYPKYKVFIDGRALDNLASKTADYMLKAYPGWKQNLDVYDINFIVVPLVFRESGHIIPIVLELAHDNDWSLVFNMQNSAVFVRNVPKNRDIIAQYNLDKRHIYREIIDVENLFLSGDPYNPVFNLAKAQALVGLERYDEAKAICKLFPNDRDAIYLLQRISDAGY